MDAATCKAAAVLFAIHCGDIGSSMNIKWHGAFGPEDLPATTSSTTPPVTTGGLTGTEKLLHQAIVNCIIKNKVTIRQFCMHLAPLVWNFYVTYRPPANWAKKGFTDATKYAGFDFFAGVEHESSARVSLSREPQPVERTAAQAAFAVYISRAASRASGYSLNAVEISRGQYLGNGARLALPAPPTSNLI